MIIDAWAQHPTERFFQHDMFASLRRWTGTSTPVGELPVAATIARMDAAGVDVSLVSAWHAPEGALISNDEVAGFVAQAPGRLVGVASVHLARPMAAVRELRRCVRELGFTALRVAPWLWDRPPDDRHYHPLYAECVELGIPFCTQVGHTGPLRTSEIGRPIPHLDNVALDFPELVIVAGHVGHPWTTEMIGVVHRHENVYIDTSACTVNRFPPELVAHLRGDRHKVLFGTDYPMITAADALTGFDELGLSVRAADWFLHGHAERIFRVEVP